MISTALVSVKSLIKFQEALLQPVQPKKVQSDTKYYNFN